MSGDQTPVVTPGVCPHCGEAATGDGRRFFDNVEDEYAYCYACGKHSLNPRWRKPDAVSHEQVLQHLLAAHGEHLRTTEDPLSLGDFVTVNYVNPLYARAAEHRPKRAIRFVEDESRGHH